jgi:uncharacterized protein involved in exopolysaccharide biosynthesis
VNLAAEPNILRSIWTHRLLVGLMAVLFAVLAVGYYLTKPLTYTADAGALLQDPTTTLDSQGNGSKSDATRYVADQVAVMKSNDVLAGASARMRKVNGVTPLSVNELQHAMTVQTDQGTSYVVVHVKADDAVTAKIAANSVIAAYRTRTKDDVQARTRAALHKLDLTIAKVAQVMAEPNRTAAQQATALALIQQLRGRRNRIEIDGQIAGDGVSLFSPAEKGKRQGAPLFATVLIGLVLGGLVGCGLAYLIDAIRGRQEKQQGPTGPTPLATRMREVPEPPEADASPPAPSAEAAEAQPVARRGRRWA